MRVAGAAVGGEGWIVGRDAELEGIERFLERRDVPRGLLIEGEAGIGKTTLLGEAARRGRERGWCVLSCSPTVPESGLSFAALGDLLAPVLTEVLPVLASPRKRALERALLIADSSDGALLDPRGIGLGVVDVLRLVAARSPVVVAIDDDQWLDPASAAALRFALPRLGDGALVLLAARRVDGSPTGLDVARAIGAERLEVLSVGELSLGAVGHLLRARSGGALTRPDVRRVHEASGGNPLFALEIAHSLRRHHSSLAGAPLELPATVQHVIRDRLAQLSAPAQRVALVTSALANARLEVVLRVASSGLEEAIDRDVLALDGNRVRFAHPLLASVAYADASAEERRLVHRELAEAVDDVEERGRQLAAAAVAPDPEVADAVDAAAARARARGAPQMAAPLAEQAVALTPAGDAQATFDRLLRAGEYAFAAGETDRARRLLGQADSAAPSRSARVSALMVTARLLYSADRDRDSTLRRTLERALAEAAGEPELEVLCRAALAALNRWSFDDAVRDAGAALARLSELDARGTEAEVRTLKAFAYACFYNGRGLNVELLQRAIELERELTQPHVQFRAASLLGELSERAGRFAVARPLIEASYQQALDEGDEASLPDRAAFLVELELCVGNWAAAEAFADECVEFASSSRQVVVHAIGEGRRAQVAAHTGREEVARASAQRSLALIPADRLPAELALSALGLLELSLGNLTAAQGHLITLDRLANRIGMREPAAWKYEGDLIEVLLGLGELDRARELLERLEQRGGVLGSAWSFAVAARSRGLCLAAEGEISAAFAALDEALASHEQLGMPFERARTMLALGRLHRRAKQRTDARAAFSAALNAFDHLGARIWAETTRGELGRLGGRTPAGNTLTPTEARVATLVASGHSNKAVAALLFVSVHTVEANLTRIYAKLGIHSRRELTQRLQMGSRKL